MLVNIYRYWNLKFVQVGCISSKQLPNNNFETMYSQFLLFSRISNLNQSLSPFFNNAPIRNTFFSDFFSKFPILSFFFFPNSYRIRSLSVILKTQQYRRRVIQDPADFHEKQNSSRWTVFTERSAVIMRAIVEIFQTEAQTAPEFDFILPGVR